MSLPQLMFRKILIANRGEIAVRIIRACQEMGIATVAVYADADAQALHTALADEAVHIGPSAPAESYLRGDKIIEAAQRTGAEAVHPGYGFLSENAAFADAVAAAGLTFIGPDASAMETMGSKTSARAAMAAAGVPVVPGYQASQDDGALIDAAAQLGYPVLVKAVAGGGGKGMRIVAAADGLPAALESARREAGNAFGDTRIYLEKLIEQPRHVEMQILADGHGNVVHLFERECSVQRRHQKIVEESPSPIMTDELRARMGAAAVAAAHAVGYVNVGTLEFLVDGARNFYFLEMNTRLQVEHPVTELVTGVDLVKAQIRIAAGEPLPFTQDQLHQRGHAIECRIYAEDPANDFLPAIGTVLRAVEPVGPGVRVDAGVTTGDTITLHYDPMIAKLVVLGEDRADAIGRMQWALRHYAVLGDVITNIPFLRVLLADPVFVAGDVTTDFVDRAFRGWAPDADGATEIAQIVAAVDAFMSARTPAPASQSGATGAGDPYSPWQSADAFRPGNGGRHGDATDV